MAGKRNERAAALDIGYLMMQAGFTREQVLEVIRIKNENADKTDARTIESGYVSRKDVSDRLRVLREAGFHGQAADDADGVHINIVVDGGKRQKPLDQIPPRS